jgi:hypothetical protein
MNCEQFRRRLLEEPNSKAPGFLAHAQRCSRCRKAWQEALEFEDHLQRALCLPPPVPRSQQPPAPPPPTPFRHLALVAGSLGLVLMVLVVSGLLRLWQEADGLPRLVVQHIHSEPGLLARHRPLDPVQVIRVMASQHYGMRRLPRSVVAAASCWIRSGRGVHLVLKGGEGAVTVLIMPAEKVAAPRGVGDAGMEGVVMPAVQGSVAVVALSPEDLEVSIDYLKQNLLWQGRPAILSF